MELEEHTLSSELLFDGKVVHLYKDEVLLPNNNTSFREYVNHNGGASILPVDKDNNIYLVKQFRYPYKEVIFEIPAGKLEVGENPFDTAIRELREETGFIVDKLIDYGCIYPSPGYTNEHLYVYVAQIDLKGTTNLDADEFLELEKMPITKAYEMIVNGQIKDAKTVYAITRFLLENSKSSR